MKEKATGKPFKEIDGLQAHCLVEQMEEIVIITDLSGVLINRRKDGSLYHEQKTITPLKDPQLFSSPARGFSSSRSPGLRIQVIG